MCLVYLKESLLVAGYKQYIHWFSTTPKDRWCQHQYYNTVVLSILPCTIWYDSRKSKYQCFQHTISVARKKFLPINKIIKWNEFLICWVITLDNSLDKHSQQSNLVDNSITLDTLLDQNKLWNHCVIYIPLCALPNLMLNFEWFIPP